MMTVDQQIVIRRATENNLPKILSLQGNVSVPKQN